MTVRLVRTVRALLAVWRAEVSASAQYRVDAAVELAVQTLWLAVAVGPVLFVYQRVDDVNGWSRGELLVIQAIWYLLDAVTWGLVVPNVNQLSHQVTTGQLDMMLLKPIDSMFYAGLRFVVPSVLVKVPLALGLGGYGLWESGATVTPVGVGAAVVAVAAAALLTWSVAVLAHTKVLTSVRFDANWLPIAIHNLSRIPVSFYGPVLSVLFTAVVPIAFLTTVPARLLVGRAQWWWALIAVAAAVALTTITRTIWGHQVRNYSGAMS